MDVLLSNLPPESRSTFENYLTLPPTTREQLSEEVHNYLETIDLIAQQHQLFDIELGQALGAALKHLINRCSQEDLFLAQVATRYYVEDEDANPDLTSSLGFEDDARVFNCVCDYLGLSELRVEF